MRRAGRKSVQRELADVEHKIFIEAAKRQDAEKALLQFRSQQSPLPFDNSRAMRDVLDEIEQVTGEKRRLREWLERGVAEAGRVSGQLPHISEAIHRAGELENEIRQTLQKMNKRHNELQQQLRGASMQVSLLQQEAATREGSGTVQVALNSPKQPECDPLLEDCLNMANKIEHLKDQCVLLEKAEAAMECLFTCSRRSLHKLGKLSVAVNTNNIWDGLETTPNESDSFDSEDGADGADDARSTRVFFLPQRWSLTAVTRVFVQFGLA
ncbi:uncharacterized protein Tco025E_05517 [Trypanosoma conorhini]|uniref:Uncharacterized protein n=1 Tax=Trypanosoma conorhini TaxID=83891 RepID=A0A422PCP7_9TRYP|nr:uncharacterized protein Tco025E_05517 [Trypanosoma conorhini]RNF15497.1 hypothetical protein Tco025E_05517 [Trypanosoma conorhini]